jgi:beta-lactamase regulating signal transducer with metallopeptidase domain
MNAFLEISLTNAAVALGLALLAAAAGRFARPAVAHTLWLLVLLKLVTPPFWHVGVPMPTAQAAPARVDVALAPAPPAAEVSVQVADTDATAAEQVASLEILPAFLLDEAPPVRAPLAVPMPVADVRPAPLEEPAAAWQPPDPAYLLGLWLTGSALLVALAVYRMAAFHRLLGHGHAAPEELQRETEALATRLGLSWCPVVWIIPGPVSPLVWAVGRRTRLVLPGGLLERLGASQRATLLAHELAHLRRRDHWVRWLELAATSLYWWHPAAWWARSRVQHLEEQCCDAWVVWALPWAARDYARALLETVNFVSEARPILPPAASGLGYVPILKRRLNMILRGPLAHRLSWPASLALIVLAMLVLPVAPYRVVAQAPDESMVGQVPTNRTVTITVDEDDKDQADDRDDDDDAKGQGDKSSAERRDLERRLSRLERQMERVIRALERSGSGAGAGRGEADESKKGEDGKSEMSEEIKTKIKEAKEKARAAAEQARERAREQVERAREQAERARERGREAAERARDRAREKARRAEGGKGEDGEAKDLDRQMKELDKQIQEAVRQAVNPERLKKMEKEIQESVSKSINPERMQQLGRQIEEAVNRSLSPQRMEQLGRQIEEAVNRSIDAEKRDRQSRRSDGDSGSSSSSSRSARRGGGSSGGGDLEQRMNRLEEKMDRLMQAIERKSSNK